MQYTMKEMSLEAMQMGNGGLGLYAAITGALETAADWMKNRLVKPLVKTGAAAVTAAITAPGVGENNDFINPVF